MSDAPWPKGVHKDYCGFVIELHVRKETKNGALSCFRRLQDEDDEKVTEQLGTTGGLEEGAQALLMESARVEIMLQILHRTTNDPDFRRKILRAGPAPDELHSELAKSTMEMLEGSLKVQVPTLVSEAIKTVSDGLRTQTG